MGHAVSGRHLSALLRDEPTLRLAVLNACKAGRTARHKPFAGLAQSLLQQGIPAVIAMQADITDTVAQEMTHEFYAAVAEGMPVDAALAEARKAIYTQGNYIAWGTPVLYMRTQDGRLFDILESANEADQANHLKINEERSRDAPAFIAQSSPRSINYITHTYSTNSRG